MAEPSAKLEITPKVIDLGDKVIQMTHVTSAGHGITHPFRPIGLAAILAAIGLVGFEVVTRGAAAFALKSGGSLLLWLGFAAAGIGLFLSLYARRLLVIRTADGARTVVPSSDENASAAVVGRIRDAMEVGGIQAVPERGRGQPVQLGATPIDPSLGARPIADRGLQSTGPSAHVPAQIASQPIFTQPLGGSRRPPEGAVNGHGSYANGVGRSDPDLAGDPTAALGRRALVQQAPQQRLPADFGQQPAAMPTRAGPSAIHADPSQHAAVREPLALPAAHTTAPPTRDDGAHDLHLLMEHVRRADVQHKDALIDLLRVIEEHYRGRASRDDAVAHWRSFADYVMQYLSDVDGMMTHTERFGRHMLAR